jgi:isopropylmalate/homocitrate/citramalate synthase
MSVADAIKRIHDQAAPVDRLASQTELRDVTLHDVTLREGLEAATVPVDAVLKRRIATLLVGLGLREIQIGYLGSSRDDWLLMSELRGEAPNVALEGICSIAGDGWTEQIDMSIDAEPDRINIAMPVSPLRLKLMRMEFDTALERIHAAVSRCAKACSVSVTPIDSSRANAKTLTQVAECASAAGADRLYVIDTAGILSPRGIASLVGAVRDASDLTVAVHCHDDLGLAVANALSAVQAGASVVDVCVGGMGKRAGNLALEEFAIALAMFWGIDCGLALDNLYDSALAVAELAGVPVTEHKAIIGAAAFDMSPDHHLRSISGHQPPPMFDPVLIGRHEANG